MTIVRPAMFFSGGATPAAEISYVSQAGDSSGGFNSSRTFSGMSFGAADSARRMFCCVGWDNAGAGFSDITAVTIGGISATKVIGTNTSDKACSIWYADVPTGTSGSVVLTGNAWGLAISLYRALNVGSIFDSASVTSSTNSVSTTVDAENEGIIVASSYVTASNLSGANMVWTGVTEGNDQAGANIARRQGSGYLEVTSDETGRTVTETCSGSSSYQHCLCVASYSKA